MGKQHKSKRGTIKPIEKAKNISEIKPDFVDIETQKVIPPQQLKSDLSKFRVNDVAYSRVGSAYYKKDVDDERPEIITETDYVEALAIYNSLSRNSPLEVRTYLPRYMEDYIKMVEQVNQFEAIYKKNEGNDMGGFSRNAWLMYKKAHDELNAWLKSQNSVNTTPAKKSPKGAPIPMMLKYTADGSPYTDRSYDKKQTNSQNMQEFYKERNQNQLEAAILENRQLQKMKYVYPPTVLPMPTGGGTTSTGGTE